ncbi:TPA: PcfJ domain-containing protein [Klebsiella aerogenes]|uniref:PcfJ domain-containing protein n=2 Tax=Klebsiella aerogenes TaxID=548 RepID=UPI001BD53D1D|nr:PcfJ domain-containing protein [Klebsiella aerogenes]HDS2184584.1 PcfJ domain-containing protein [Klebsiella aerogenes]HDT0435739.1 PcfJ domain-containing protein [Klebsiella aerogenes]HDT4320120.1 PcfJ domain-containing protein [Klebsiella aerogenes]HDT4798927.1 PcfJ domain-containing protein [Klebsiella aerogenes]HDU4048502.1 PcfJ domain-containing protein [Klebsiella aerogenes]
MKIYLLKNKIFISFLPHIRVVIKVYVEDGQILSDIFHGTSVQRKELDCGLPLFNERVMGRSTVEHLLNMLGENINDSVWELLGYNDGQVETYNAITASHSLNELFCSCPNLAWAIIINNYYGVGFHVVEYYARMKRRQLAASLIESPPEEKVVNLLKKTEMLSGRKYELVILSRCLQELEIIESYKHHDKVTIQELYLSYRYRILSGSKLLASLCSEKKEFLRDYKVGMCTLSKIVEDSVRIGENIGIKDSLNIIANCSDSESVKYYHDKWTVKLRETTKLLRDDISLEHPALLDCQGIEFLSSINKLIVEGREMEHCLASYKEKVMKKESFIYKVTAITGERITLELGFSKGKYFIKQAKGFRNAEPSNAVRGFYNTWLTEENERLKLIAEEGRLVHNYSMRA